MSLKDVLTAPAAPAAPESWFEKMERTLPADDFEWLVACIKDKNTYSGSYIARKMTAYGYPVSSTTINTIRGRIGA